MNYEERYFAPNGIVTYEDCPVCGAPDMRVEHGKSGRGSLQHYEHCTECGDSMPIVCYDCPSCLISPEADDGLLKGQVLRDGEPCDHPGCLSHISHPCEGCGRIGGYKRDPVPTNEE